MAVPREVVRDDNQSFALAATIRMPRRKPELPLAPQREKNPARGVRQDWAVSQKLH
jgi:hypothetical protein